MFRKTLIAGATLLSLSLGAPTFASDSIDPTLEAKLTEQLVAEGYEVRKLQMEDGLIEAYAVKDGKTYELYFDTDLKPVEKDGDSD